MTRYLIYGALLMVMASTLAFFNRPAAPIQKAYQIPKLERPEFTWVQCPCGDEIFGLNKSDYIKQTMYVSGLEHEYRECRK